MFWIITLVLLLAIAAFPFVREAMRKPVEVARKKSGSGTLAPLPSGHTYYEWHGHLNGPVAVLVHGLSTPSFVWGGVIEILTKMGFRILTYDLYGRGKSDRVSGAQDQGFHLRQLNELLEDQGITEPFTLFGYSMGGAIATAYAVKNPGNLERLVLLAPAGLKHDLGRLTKFVVKYPVLGDWIMLAFGGRDLKRGIRAEQAGYTSVVPDIHAKQAEQLEYKGYLPAILSSLRHFLTHDQAKEHKALAATDLPVLAVWGEDDTVIPLTCLGRLAQINRNARQVSIPGAPHGLTYTHPTALREALQELMRDGL